MNTITKKLFSKLTIWLFLEIILTLLNLDNLADYSEFLNRSLKVNQSFLPELIQF